MKIKSSLLIITRNRSLILGDCLDALKSEIDQERHEVLIVDSSEDDKTENLIKNYPWVRYYHIVLPLGTRPQAYSYGAKLTKGEIVVLLDDDSIVFPRWLSSIESCYINDSVGAVGGRVLPREGIPLPAGGKDNTISSIKSNGRIVSNLYMDPGHPVEVDVLRGCNMSVRKALLDKMGYFDSRFRGQNCRVEDDICLWVKRFGYKVIFEPKAVVRHLAEPRPDIPRSETNMRSEFYVCRNTVWLYIKHFGFKPRLLLCTAFFQPLLTSLRRICGDSLKRPKINRASSKYIPSFLASLWGGLWGFIISVLYSLQDAPANRGNNDYPKLKFLSNDVICKVVK